MKWNKKIAFVILTLVLILALNSNVSAQRHYYGRGYHSNYYAYSYRPSRPYVSVNIGRPYGYYHPYSYRPVYRAPYSYVHFGPSFGVHINVLPFGYYPFYFGGNPYYYYNGIYYRQYSGGGYEVTAPPLGATIKNLPSGAKVTVIDGVKYYEVGGTFYQEEITDKNKLRYKVVGTDGVLNTGTDEEADTDSAPVTPNNATPNNNIVTPPAAPPVTPQNNTTAAQLPEVGTRFDKLPEGSKVVVLKKEKYYVSPAGVYYQEVIDGNNVRYEVTGNSETEK